MLTCLLVAAAGLAGPLRAPAQDAATQRRTEAELAEVQREIGRVREQVAKDAAERDRLTGELRRAESAVSRARAGLDAVRRQRQEIDEQRAQMLTERRSEERNLAKERAALGSQLRAAYALGREEPLKLLLNQREPARAGRMFAYYGYFGRARGEQIERIVAHVARLGELEQSLTTADEKLAALENTQREQLAQLQTARSERGVVLQSFRSEARSRAASLDRLKQQQSLLEKLLRELRRAAQRFPVEGRGPFATLKGQLAWPVEGRALARFGERRAGALRWEGMLLAAERGAPVRAIYHGRVLYADWLAGLGLLVIVDHGDGYLSLYGHNDQLYRKVGERVTAGDVLAAAGDSGGRERPQLYFEIRRSGRPLDPQPWFRSR